MHSLVNLKKKMLLQDTFSVNQGKKVHCSDRPFTCGPTLLQCYYCFLSLRCELLILMEKKGFEISREQMDGGGGEEAGSSSAPKAAQCANGNDGIASCCADKVEGQEERKDVSDQEGMESEDEEHEFVPGPLLSLKDELERDKVMLFLFLSFFPFIVLLVL
jgi:hypothetical protein